MNEFMSCYGHTAIRTPTFDAMAEHGVRFTRFYVTTPVCSASRSGLVLGAMQTTFNARHHRSSRSIIRDPRYAQFGRIELPDGVVPVHRLFRAAGYTTCIQGKTDFNFVCDTKALSTVKDWLQAIRSKRPWFVQLQTRGGKGGAKSLTREEKKNAVDESKIRVPAYFPDHPVFKGILRAHYLNVLGEDKSVGQILAELEDAGQLENTFVFFLSDHGMPGSPRHKQFCYEGGIRVPLIVRLPENFKIAQYGTVRHDLVSGIDLAPTSLALAGIEIPKWMEGKNIFAKNDVPREYVISARDRCDFTIDRIRAVVSKRFKYIRNGFPNRPYLQPQYRDDHPSVILWKQLYAEGKLTPEAAAFAAPTRPVEELYDLENDPDEVRNLAADPAHADVLARHRRILDQWIKETGDKGQQPESPESLLQVLVRWGDQRCVNPEYDLVREKYKDVLPELLRERSRRENK